jgi:hypothetical protein
MTTKQQSGFGIVPIILTLAVIAVLGYVGYRVYTTQTGKPANSSVANNQTNATNTTPGTTQTQVDPYVSWKTYCDIAKKACFKYPADWSISPHSNNGIYSAVVKSPDQKLEVDYSGYYAVDSRDTTYSIISIDDLTKPTTSWKVLGRVATSDPTNSTLEYQLVDQSLITNLKVGQTISMVNTARFTFQDQTTGHLVAYSTSADPKTDAAKTLLLIERSFYLE